MTEYEKLKVTELKEELKKRSIPSTGLTRKQQIIDRLIQDDAEKAPAKDATDAAPIIDNAPEAEPEQPSIESVQAETTNVALPQPIETTKSAENEGVEETKTAVQEPAFHEPTITERAQVEDIPAALAEESVVQGETTVEPADEAKQESPTTKDDIEVALPATPSQDRKRKRRSITPSVHPDSVQKKLKGTEEDVVHLEKEEKDMTANDAVMPDVPLDQPDATILPMATSDDVMDITNEPIAQTATSADVAMEQPADEDAQPSRTMRSPNERRYKDLISAPDKPSTTSQVQPTNDDLDSLTEPALHPATRALYIRDLVRPLQPSALRDHLSTLATPPDHSSTTSSDSITSYHVDTLRTHAFILFTTPTAASRVRTALHARIWPPEPTRKPLWADFIPQEKFHEWVALEQSTSGTRPSQAKRWEVLYHSSDSGVEVELVEASGSVPQHRNSFQAGMAGVPTAPRGARASFSQPQPQVQAPAQKVVEETNASFIELDKLFRHTVAKPKLYWQPVKPSLAERRLDELKAETSRDWDAREDGRRNGESLGRGLDQLKRYTFEDGDVLVDGGMEYGGGRAFERGGEGFRGRGGRRGGDWYR